MCLYLGTQCLISDIIVPIIVLAYTWPNFCQVRYTCRGIKVQESQLFPKYNLSRAYSFAFIFTTSSIISTSYLRCIYGGGAFLKACAVAYCTFLLVYWTGSILLRVTVGHVQLSPWLQPGWVTKVHTRDREIQWSHERVNPYLCTWYVFIGFLPEIYDHHRRWQEHRGMKLRCSTTSRTVWRKSHPTSWNQVLSLT